MRILTREPRGNFALVTAPPSPGADVGEADPATAWRRRAIDLADWILPLIVREDAHGGADSATSTAGWSSSGRLTSRH